MEEIILNDYYTNLYKGIGDVNKRRLAQVFTENTFFKLLELKDYEKELNILLNRITRENRDFSHEIFEETPFFPQFITRTNQAKWNLRRELKPENDYTKLFYETNFNGQSYEKFLEDTYIKYQLGINLSSTYYGINKLINNYLEMNFKNLTELSIILEYFINDIIQTQNDFAKMIKIIYNQYIFRFGQEEKVEFREKKLEIHKVMAIKTSITLILYNADKILRKLDTFNDQNNYLNGKEIEDDTFERERIIKQNNSQNQYILVSQIEQSYLEPSHFFSEINLTKMFLNNPQKKDIKYQKLMKYLEIIEKQPKLDLHSYQKFNILSKIITRDNEMKFLTNIMTGHMEENFHVISKTTKGNRPKERTLERKTLIKMANYTEDEPEVIDLNLGKFNTDKENDLYEKDSTYKVKEINDPPERGTNILNKLRNQNKTYEIGEPKLVPANPFLGTEERLIPPDPKNNKIYQIRFRTLYQLYKKFIQDKNDHIKIYNHKYFMWHLKNNIERISEYIKKYNWGYKHYKNLEKMINYFKSVKFKNKKQTKESIIIYGKFVISAIKDLENYIMELDIDKEKQMEYKKDIINNYPEQEIKKEIEFYNDKYPDDGLNNLALKIHEEIDQKTQQEDYIQADKPEKIEKADEIQTTFENI